MSIRGMPGTSDAATGGIAPGGCSAAAGNVRFVRHGTVSPPERKSLQPGAKQTRSVAVRRGTRSLRTVGFRLLRPSRPACGGSVLFLCRRKTTRSAFSPARWTRRATGPPGNSPELACRICAAPDTSAGDPPNEHARRARDCSGRQPRHNRSGRATPRSRGNAARRCGPPRGRKN